MQLVLRNAHLINQPAGLTDDQVDELDEARTRIRLKLAGVESMHYLLAAVTVRFSTHKQCETARQRTGWQVAGTRVLEATTLTPGEHVSIVAGDHAYSDFDLIPDPK